MYMTELDESLVGSYNQQNYRYRNYLYNLYRVAAFTGQIFLNSIHPYISEVEGASVHLKRLKFFNFFLLYYLFYFFNFFFFFKNFHLYLLIS